MGCGSSSSAKSPKDGYYNRGNDYKDQFRNNPQYNERERQGEDYYNQGKNYYDDGVRNNPQRKPSDTPPRKSQPTTNHDSDEDDTPFDDDGDTGSPQYSKNNAGVMVEELDCRSKCRDDDPEQRPKINQGKLFVDDEFPRNKASSDKGVEWKRPKDFQEDPRLFVDGATRCDIGQGTVGTCWFLPFAAFMASRKDLLNQVIPASAYKIEDPNKYDGVFNARFFMFGKWDNVYTDDYLPVMNGRELWSVRSASDDREMCMPLLEKAFAKTYGSYSAAYGCQPGDACLLLTGGVGERVDHNEYKQEDKYRSFSNRLKNACHSGCEVACLVLDEYDNQKGLVGGQPYALIDVCEVKNAKVILVKLRSPPDQGEWKGPWSDGSPEWSNVQQNSVPPTKKNDGEFYISIQDYLKYFSQTTICSLTPDFDCDGISDPLNYVINIYGEWHGKSAAGFQNLFQNQKFTFTVTDQGLVDNSYIPLVIQMIQQSKKRRIDNVPIRCDLFEVVGDKISRRGRSIALKTLGKKNNVYTPELQAIFRYKLRPGRYMIIASTANKGQEKAFLLRIFTPVPLYNVKEIPAQTKIVSCENENTIDVKGRNYQLNFEKALFGEFIHGVNAGGQVSNQSSYHSNPQYLVTVRDSAGDVLLAISVLQTREDTQCPIGIRIFKLDNTTKPPLDIKYLYNHYDDCPKNVEGQQSKFEISWSVDTTYMLRPGRYIVLVHQDQPNTEKSFCITFKSTDHVAIKGFQTG